MVYKIKVPVFEGPLDLLLHLIEKNEVDIYNIPIALIVQQYLEYLALAREVDLELTSEFLLMVCTLLAIKARMLLPRHAASSEEEEEEEDPRRELVEKLLEYKIYKEVAGEFREKEILWSKVFWREIDEAKLLKEFPPLNPLGTVTMADLFTAYNHVLRKYEKKREVVSITRDEITVREKIEYILNRLYKKPSGLSFKSLFSGMSSRSEVIVTFLALLELARRGTVMLRQAHLFSDILIFLNESKGGEDSADSVSG
ncbi:MAG: segregation/condensation protein A [Peptococcaceae bacterium]|jgi:segregation and condensation protein A|nr:segregation/condensation protein A [Peptococcaceae bacterium]MDH7525927.1 segregation/condensation protein A [Peptococcaceae bacterium]